MRFPIQLAGPKFSNANYHGPQRTPRRCTVRIVRLQTGCPAWRLILYGTRGQWWHLDIFVRGFRR